MKPRQTFRFGAVKPVLAFGFLASISYVQAQTNGTWTANASGNWSDTTKWSGGLVASGTSAIADFSTLNITANNVVTIDAPYTIGTLKCQDATTPSNNWTFAGTNALTLANGASQPVLDMANNIISSAGTVTATISAPLAGTNGFSKTGQGWVTLTGDNSALSGAMNLPDVASSNNAGVVLGSAKAIGGITTINIGGTGTASGQFLALSGNVTLGTGVTINLNSQGGNSAPPGGLRGEGTNADVATVEGPVNITLGGNAARIANNSAKRLDITGKITGGANGITFRFGKNDGVHITNTANTWSGQTVHSEDTFWFEPNALPTTTNLQICASNPGTVQTNGTFTRELGSGANQVQFSLSSTRAQGFGARGGALTLNFGGAGADVLFDTNAGAAANRIRTSTLVLNGATADSDITLVNPIDINGVARNIQVSSQTATLQGGIKGGNFAVTKTSSGTLHISGASNWTGGLVDNNAGIVRISHNEALGAPATAKSIQMRGTNRQISILELTGGITVDANKTLNISGKSFYSNTETAIGNQVSLRNLSGNNTWLGSVNIAETGGAYAIESTAGTLTLGADPSTASQIKNTTNATITAPATTDNRQMSFFGAGNFVVNNKVADNGAYNTGVNHLGTGTLSLTRSDNDFDQVPNLWSGNTEVVKMADSGNASSLGVAASFTLGSTLKYTGAGDSSNRALGLLQKGGTLDSSGTGPLVLSSATMTHQSGTTSLTCAPFALGASVLTVDNASGVVVGQTVAGTGLAANTTITAINVASRQITLSAPTTAASASGFGVALTISGAANLDRTLTLTGSNAGGNTLAASLSNPGTGKLGVTKTGAGKWLLSGATKTNTGPINVQSGTLGFVNSLPPSFAPTVDSAATLSLDTVSLEGTPALNIAGTLEITGPVNVALADNPAPGTYNLLQYGALTGGGVLTAPYRTYSIATPDSTSTSLTVGAGSSLTWTGAISNDWDVNGALNWQNASAGAEKFYWLDSVTFDSTGSLYPSVVLTQNVRPNQITVNEALVDYSFSGTGSISGTGSLVKSGAATLTISTANSFSGGISLNAGTIKAGGNQSLGGNGQVITVASGATLNTNGSLTASRDYAATIAGAGTDGNGAIVNTGTDHQTGFGSLLLSDNATIGGTGRWDVRPISAGTAFIDLNGKILTKTGTNIVAFVDGSMPSDGTININQGILSFTRMVTSGTGNVNVNSGGTLRFENHTAGSFNKSIALNDGTIHLTGSNMTVDGPITLTGTGNFSIAFTRTFTASQPVDGTGNLSLTSAGTGAVGVLTLQNDNTYSGTTTVDTGTLRIGNRTTTGSINALPVSLANNGNVQISRSDAYTFPNVIQGTGGVLIGANVAVTAPEYDSLVTLTGNNTFTGGVTVYSGGLKIKNAAAIGTGDKTITLVAGTAGRPQFYLDGAAGNITLPTGVNFITSSANLSHPAIGNLAGDNVINGNFTISSGGGSTALSVIGGSLTLNGTFSADTSARFVILGGNTGAPGTINGVIGDGTNPLGIVMSGSNTWTLTGTNTYTGTTTVNSGTLLVNGTQNVATGAVTVAGGTLGGNGTIGGNITVNAGGTLAPGASTGTLTAVNSVTVGGTLGIDVSGANSDKLAVGSTLNISAATLNVNVGAAPTEPVYIIASYGALTGTFASTTGIPAGYSIDYNYNSLNQIALVGSADPYGSWETANGIAGAGAAADSDGDGISNGIEFVIGGDPSGPGSASNGLLPAVSVDATYLTFVFRRTDESAGYNPFAEYGSDLAGWTQAQNGVGGVIVTTTDEFFGTGVDRVTVQIPRALAAPGGKFFARLHVTIP